MNSILIFIQHFIFPSYFLLAKQADISPNAVIFRLGLFYAPPLQNPRGDGLTSHPRRSFRFPLTRPHGYTRRSICKHRADLFFAEPWGPSLQGKTQIRPRTQREMLPQAYSNRAYGQNVRFRKIVRATHGSNVFSQARNSLSKSFPKRCTEARGHICSRTFPRLFSALCRVRA